MKKFIRAIALIALVALLCSCAFAEGSSFEALLAQRQELDRSLIASEGFGPFIVAQGEFSIGVDLPAGSYRIESAALTAVAVYSAAPADEANLVAEYTVTQEEPLEALDLAEDNVLVMTGSQATFTVIAIEGEPAAASVEELLAQRKALDEQIAALPEYTKLKTAQATLTVGIDIPAGMYCTNSSPMCVVAIYKGDPHVDENLVTMYTVTGNEPIEKFELEEGLILLINGMMDIEISTYTGLKLS